MNMMKYYTVNKHFKVLAKSFDQAVKLYNQQNPNQQVVDIVVNLVDSF
jgi:hypothetical protein